MNLHELQVNKTENQTEVSNFTEASNFVFPVLQ